METGELMRVARLAARIGLDAMAGLTGFSKSYLSMMECGTRPVRPWHIDAYERVLGVEIGRLDGARQVGHRALEEVSAILAGTRRLEDAVGARYVLPAVRGLAVLAGSLANDARAAVVQPALAVASEVTQYRGWLELATGSPASAHKLLATAVKLGVESKDADRLAHGLSFKAYASLSHGDIASAGDLTDAALRVRRAHPAIRVYDLFQRARVHAEAGEVHAAERALAAADRAIDRLGDDLPESGYWYTPGFWALQRGEVLWALGNRDAALAEIAAGLAALPDDHRSAEWAEKWVRAATRPPACISCSSRRTDASIRRLGRPDCLGRAGSDR